MNKEGLIKSEILGFYSRLQYDPHHRFRSWEHCYKYFKSNDLVTDNACLHLGFYLASWGMYRGSSFLLQKDYRIHKPAVTEILKPKYNHLRSANFEQYRGSKGEENIGLLFELIDNVKICYEGIGDTNKKDANVTDTLVTKILLGTLGCIPAYDRFFITGLKAQGLTYSGVRKSNFIKMVDFCFENTKEFKSAQKEIASKKYPLMKLVDMYFWSLGEKMKDK
jgi:hypothetical protein